jgi:hypothetical protein
MAETSLEELKQAFIISSSAELGTVDQESKIKIYANRHQNYTQRYFEFDRNGIMIDVYPKSCSRCSSATLKN